MNYRYYVSNWFIPRGQIALNLGPITIIKKESYMNPDETFNNLYSDKDK